MPASKFRKKPVEVSAIRWDGSVASATEVINWILAASGTARFHDKVTADDVLAADAAAAEVDWSTATPEQVRAEMARPAGRRRSGPAYIAIDTLEGTMRASEGDWIIRGVQGEHYPCKPEIFWATYDIVDDRG